MTLPARSGEDATLAAAVDGDAAAFGDLVRLHRDHWYTLALRLLGDPEAAAEATQEATIRAWKGIGSFRGDATFSTWTYRIVVNAAWSQRRKRSRHQTVSIDQCEDPVHDPLDAHAERIETRRRMSDALTTLSPANRAVVVLKDVYGWSHGEVSEALGITVTAAKVRLHRGRAALRRTLGDSLS